MITTENYTSLVTSSHKDKPKFVGVVEANTKFYAHLQNVLNSMIDLFDVDVAVGDQLDKIGEWVGVTRYVSTPLTGIYFAWDSTALVGWDSGIWKDEFSPTTTLARLDDQFFRILIRAKIAANKWDGTIPDAYRIWEEIFSNNTILIQDLQNMTMIVGVVGSPLDAVTQALLVGGYLALKPEGVQIKYYAVPNDSGLMFAWDSEGLSVGGWDESSWANLITPS